MMATARAVLAIVFVLLGAACGEEDAGSRSAGASVPAVTPGVAGYNPVSATRADSSGERCAGAAPEPNDHLVLVALTLRARGIAGVRRVQPCQDRP